MTTTTVHIEVYPQWIVHCDDCGVVDSFYTKTLAIKAKARHAATHREA